MPPANSSGRHSFSSLGTRRWPGFDGPRYSRAVSTRAELIDALLRLPTNERAAAARVLLGSLDEEAPRAEHARAWELEIERRIADVDAGEVEMEDGERALAQLRERAAARSARRTT